MSVVQVDPPLKGALHSSKDEEEIAVAMKLKEILLEKLQKFSCKLT